jgi:hypothetical protein
LSNKNIYILSELKNEFGGLVARRLAARRRASGAGVRGPIRLTLVNKKMSPIYDIDPPNQTP